MDTNNAQEWVNDPKNRPTVIVGAIIVFGIGAFACFHLYGPKQVVVRPAGGTTTGTVPAATAPGAVKPGGPAAPGAVAPAGAMGAPRVGAAPGVPGPGFPGAVTAAAPAPATTASLGPMLPYRKDPFAVAARVPKPTKTSVIRAALTMLPPYSISTDPLPIVSNAVAETVKEVTPEQPFRRMSGVMMDGTVSAVLETRSDAGIDSDVVVPGMELNRGNSKVRVERITSSEIILKTLDTKTPMTIRVNLAGSSTLSGGKSNVSGISPIQ